MTPEPKASDSSSGAWPSRRSLGVVLAGGASRRFGQDKALFPLAERPMAAWALEAVRAHTDTQAVIANTPDVGRTLGVRWRRDVVPGLGPLGGLLTALDWAAEEGREAVLLLACDLPLVTPSLLGHLLRAWEPGSTALVPQSSGPLGFEPLCGAYAVSTLSVARGRATAEDSAMEDPAKKDRVMKGRIVMDRSMKGFLNEVGGAVVPAHHLGPAADLALAFRNVNTEPEARWAERVLRDRSPSFRRDSRSEGAAPESPGRAP